MPDAKGWAASRPLMRGGESVDDRRLQRPKPPPWLFLHERIFHPDVMRVGQRRVRHLCRHENQHPPVLGPANGCEHPAEDVTGEHSAESRVNDRVRLDSAARHKQLLEPSRLKDVHPAADQRAVREFGDRDRPHADEDAPGAGDGDDQNRRDRLQRLPAAPYGLQPVRPGMNQAPDSWAAITIDGRANQRAREHCCWRQAS